MNEVTPPKPPSSEELKVTFLIATLFFMGLMLAAAVMRNLTFMGTYMAMFVVSMILVLQTFAIQPLVERKFRVNWRVPWTISVVAILILIGTIWNAPAVVRSATEPLWGFLIGLRIAIGVALLMISGMIQEISQYTETSIKEVFHENV